MNFLFAMGYPLSPSSPDLPLWKSSSGPEAPVPNLGKRKEGVPAQGLAPLRMLRVGMGVVFPPSSLKI